MLLEFILDLEAAFSLGIIAWVIAIGLNTPLHLNFTTKQDIVFGLAVMILTMCFVNFRRWFMRGWASGRL